MFIFNVNACRILQLLNKRKLEKLKETWWNNNPANKKCEKEDDQADGISIQNIGGVFIVIFMGIGLACITLGFEYWWFKWRKRSTIIDVKEAEKKKSHSKKVKDMNDIDAPKEFATSNTNFGFRARRSFMNVNFPGRF